MGGGRVRAGHLSPWRRCAPLMCACGATSTVTSRRKRFVPRRGNKRRQLTASLENAHGAAQPAAGKFLHELAA